jgi:hypothetical protein
MSERRFNPCRRSLPLLTKNERHDRDDEGSCGD